MPKRDAIIPLFVLQEFVDYPGVAGLFISCLFSGALSTLDSTMNALAAVTWEEVKAFSCFEGDFYFYGFLQMLCGTICMLYEHVLQ